MLLRAFGMSAIFAELTRLIYLKLRKPQLDVSVSKDLFPLPKEVTDSVNFSGLRVVLPKAVLIHASIAGCVNIFK